MNIYTEPQQLIDPKKLIKLLKDIDDEYVFSFMNKAEVDERLDAIIEQYKKDNK